MYNSPTRCAEYHACAACCAVAALAQPTPDIDGERVHRDIPIRSDVIAYLREALDFYGRNETAGKKAWMEIGMLAGSGVEE